MTGLGFRRCYSAVKTVVNSSIPSPCFGLKHRISTSPTSIMQREKAKGEFYGLFSTLSGLIGSAEANLGLQVENLWDVQAAQLAPSDKLNACFEEIPVSSFPRATISSVEIGSDSSLAEAVRVLAKHRLLSAPVVDANAPQDASWVDRYIGVVEFAGIVVWILQQAFKLMRINGVGGIPVLDSQGRKTVGNMSIGDVELLLTEPDIYKEYSCKKIQGRTRGCPTHSKRNAVDNLHKRHPSQRNHPYPGCKTDSQNLCSRSGTSSPSSYMSHMATLEISLMDMHPIVEANAMDQRSTLK